MIGFFSFLLVVSLLGTLTFLLLGVVSKVQGLNKTRFLLILMGVCLVFALTSFVFIGVFYEGDPSSTAGGVPQSSAMPASPSHATETSSSVPSPVPSSENDLTSSSRSHSTAISTKDVSSDAHKLASKAPASSSTSSRTVSSRPASRALQASSSTRSEVPSPSSSVDFTEADTNTMVYMVDEAMKSSLGEEYVTTSYSTDSKTLLISICVPDTALEVSRAQLGIKENVKAWEQIKSNMNNLWYSIENIVLGFPLEGVDIVLEIQNDENPDRSLLRIKDGFIVYDALDG